MRYQGMKDQIKGKVEELKGKLTGNRTLEAKGKARQQWGNAKAKAHDVLNDVREGWDKRQRYNDENPERQPRPEANP